MTESLQQQQQQQQQQRKQQAEMVGPYILGRTLGKGTTGKVKAGEHKDTGVQVAVKIIKKAYVATHKNKVAREIAVMRLLDHPHVLKLYDVLETSQHIFLVMERVKGGELFDYILQKGRLPRHEALRIMAQVVQGVEFCHMHSICHRDIKPENLLLDEHMNIRIADFGMAQVSPGGPDNLLDTFCGSPHYGAPEVVSGIPYDGRKSDVWSMGVVFYALVTGMLPFDNPNVSTLLRMVKRGVYHMPRLVPLDIADLIRRMLTLDVAQRITTPEIKFHPCFQNESGISLYFPPTPHPSPALEMMRTHPITCKEDIDQTILEDLAGLGWGTAAEIEEKILTNTDVSMKNLESVFYFMLAARNQVRIKEERTYMPPPPEPPTPGPVSFMEPTSSMSSRSPTSSQSQRRLQVTTPTREAIVAPIAPSPRSRAASATAATSVFARPLESKAAAADSNGSVDAERVTGSSSNQGARSRLKNRLAIKIVPKENDLQVRPETTTTPRFHRLKLASTSQEEINSPSGPITPTAKKSWFKNLFRRRPSVDCTGAKEKNRASGMYSQKTPEELLTMIRKVMETVGVSHYGGSRHEHELKCEATCAIDSQTQQLIIYDKTGAVAYKSLEEGKQSESKTGYVPKQEEPQAQDGVKLPLKSPKNDLSKPQTVKFSIEITREASGGVSCVSLNHRAGDMVIYHCVHTEVLKQFVL